MNKPNKWSGPLKYLLAAVLGCCLFVAVPGCEIAADNAPRCHCPPDCCACDGTCVNCQCPNPYPNRYPCPDGKCPVAPVFDCPYELRALDEVPMINPPYDARAKNHSGGSCYYVSFETSLIWQGHEELAAAYRKANAGGASTSTIAAAANRLGIKFASSDAGDANFLDWCMRTRRPPAITFKSNHAINLVHLDPPGTPNAVAIVLDNNTTQNYDAPIPRDVFLSRWRGYGGGAIVPIYDPAPPMPVMPVASLKPAERIRELIRREDFEIAMVA